MHLMWVLVGFSDPIYLQVNTTPFCSNIIALSIGVSVDPLFHCKLVSAPYFLPYYKYTVVLGQISTPLGVLEHRLSKTFDPMTELILPILYVELTRSINPQGCTYLS